MKKIDFKNLFKTEENNNSKTKKLSRKFVIIICSVVLVILLVIMMFSIIVQKNANAEPKIIAEKVFANFSDNVQHNGSLLLSDGSVYSWTFEGSVLEYNVAELDDSTKLIEYAKKNGKKENISVSQQDINTIMKLGKTIKQNTDISCDESHSGSTSIYVQNKTDLVTLLIEGECVGTNDSENTNKVLKIIQKYLK